MRLVIMGPPGVGKGTQADILAARLGISKLSTGDMLRTEIKAGTELGLFAKERIDHGEFVPDEMISEIVNGVLVAPEMAGGYILDGYPRTTPQAKNLIASGQEIERVLLLEADDEILLDRIAARAGDRPDDNPDTARLRLEIYRERTKPVADFFASLNLLSTVDGSGSVDAVTAALLEVLGRIPAESVAAP